MTITYLPIDQFLKEVKEWGADKSTLHKVRRMDIGDVMYLRFSIPGKHEVIESAILLSQYREFYRMDIDPVAIEATWVNEIDEIRKLITKLEEINGRTTNNINNRNQNILSKQR